MIPNAKEIFRAVEIFDVVEGGRDIEGHIFERLRRRGPVMRGSSVIFLRRSVMERMNVMVLLAISSSFPSL